MGQPLAAPKHEEWLDFWEQRELAFFKLIPYPLLVLCLIFDFALRHGFGSDSLIDLGLAAGAAGLLAVADTLERRCQWGAPGGPEPSPILGTTLFGALAALAAVLVVRQPIFGFFSWTGYIWSWRLLRGNWRFLGVAVAALITSISQTGAGPYTSATNVIGLVAVYTVNLSVASAFTWFGWVGNEQQQRRAARVSALTEANTRLEETMRDNAELHERLLVQAREAGVADERQRMAREIHDTLAQGLTGIITQLQAARTAGAGQQAGADHIEAAIGLARESLSEARRSVHALAPEPLEGARLPDAVGDVATRWSSLHGVPVAFTTTGTARVVRPDVEVALLRTAQEALANVAKHARAGRVGLTLSYMEDLVTLDVRDDGIGFAAARARGPREPDCGFGLDSMRQRVEGVGGRFAIESEPGSGTAVSAAVPVAVAP